MTTVSRRSAMRRATAFPAAMGVVVGALVTGLIVPFAVGDDATVGTASTFDARSGGSGDDLSGSTSGSGSGPLDDGTATSTVDTGGGSTAPSSPGVSRSAPTGGGAPGTGTGRLASDVGVTPATIKLGIVLLDLATANTVGLAPDHYEIETQRKAYQAHIDAINAAGGIHGRTIEAVYAVADPFNPDTAIAACNSLTEDHKVFMASVFAGYTADGMLCVAQTHRTPLVVFGWPPDEHFQKTEGRMVSDGMAANRIMFNWVHELDRMRLIQGKTIGIVADEDTSNGDKQAVDQGLLPALRQYGYKAAYRTRLSDDLHTAASQIPLEVQRMRAAGVDTVMLPTTFLYATQWVQNAESQGWRPQYHVSDLQGLTCDVCVEDMPSSFHGAYGITDRHFIRGAREGMPEPEPDRRCRETYNRATGESWKYGDRHPLYNTCVQIELVRRTLLAAGENPTRVRWTAGARSAGDFPLATAYGGGLNGKTDYSDVVVTIRWDTECKDSPQTSDTEEDCYRTIDEPRRTRY